MAEMFLLNGEIYSRRMVPNRLIPAVMYASTWVGLINFNLWTIVRVGRLCLKSEESGIAYKV